MVKGRRLGTAQRRWVSYCRVSTDKQGRSGLGLEAQRRSISEYLHRQGGQLVAEYIEVESGKKDDRPQLEAALLASQRLGARLIIAKLDRLSRDVAFIASLMKSSADFVVVEYPEANRLTLHIMAAVAEEEREAISKRTREALASAKARGVKLGKPENLMKWAEVNPELAKQGRDAGSRALQEKADTFAQSIVPLISELRAEGRSLNATARHLNDTGVRTARGGKWTARSVSNVLARAT